MLYSTQSTPRDLLSAEHCCRGFGSVLKRGRFRMGTGRAKVSRDDSLRPHAIVGHSASRTLRNYVSLDCLLWTNDTSELKVDRNCSKFDADGELSLLWPRSGKRPARPSPAPRFGGSCVDRSLRPSWDRLPFTSSRQLTHLRAPHNVLWPNAAAAFAARRTVQTVVAWFLQKTVLASRFAVEQTSASSPGRRCCVEQIR